MKLVLDTHCEVYDLLKPWADAEFWNLREHISDGKLIPGAVYLLGRQQLSINLSTVRELITNETVKIVFSNPAEGSSPLKYHCENVYQISDLIKSNQILLIGGGDMDSSWPCLNYDCFLPKILDYRENALAIGRSKEIYTVQNKPYKFLFLNGRARSHRTHLLQRFQSSGLLDKSIWSNLDSANGVPVRPLPVHYEITEFRANYNPATTKPFIKSEIFGDVWGEIYIKPEPYIDTYFSVVTETVFNYPHSFRTEKIWKPVAIGHPWIAVSNQGFYRDIRNLGFKTFDHLIDESFDNIDRDADRLERIATIVEDLCQQDLAKFLNECYNVCKYNQQHLAEMRIKVRKEFPDRFFNFIKKYNFDE